MHSMTASLQGAAYSLVFAIDKQTLSSLTPTNIKLAILKKRAGKAVVQEYTAEVVIPDPNPGASGPAATHAQQQEQQTTEAGSSQQVASV
ncbi:hypothetical protein V1264_010072 [Littorina saxatilis]